MDIARVIPIYKSIDYILVPLTHNISILPKILEKVIATKLIQYLDFNKLFYKHQYGLRPKHNTTHPIMHLLNQIHVAMSNEDTKVFTLSVFIDLSKAFDTISPEILFHKLENLGIRCIANNYEFVRCTISHARYTMVLF